MILSAYLQVSDSSQMWPNKEQKLTLSDEDKSTLRTIFKEKLAIARTINNLHYRSGIISDIALEMAKVGLDKTEVIEAFKEALYWEVTQADELYSTNPDKKRPGIFHNEAVSVKWMLSKMAKAGLNKSDTEKARHEVKVDIQIRTDLRIDRNKYPLSEQDKCDLLKMFSEKLQTVRNSKASGDEKAIAVSDVALGMAFAGADKNKLCKTFKEAISLEMAYATERWNDKNNNKNVSSRDYLMHYEKTTLDHISSKMTDAGIDQRDKQNVYDGIIMDIWNEGGPK